MFFQKKVLYLEKQELEVIENSEKLAQRLIFYPLITKTHLDFQHLYSFDSFLH